MSKEKRWQQAEVAPEDWLKQFPEINPIILQLLYNRNLKTQTEIEDFLSPDYYQNVYDPFLFRDMNKVVKRIWQAIDEKEKIVVFGDYDADGVCSSVILADFLKNQGNEPIVIIPHRSKDGYGLTQKSVEKIIKIKLNLLITLDCGSTNVAEVEILNKNKIDTIIIDHHHEPADVPKSFAILNCAFPEETYPTKNLASGGMVYKVVQALVSYGREHKKIDTPEGWEKWYLDLVSIATVADMVPLLGENRTLVKFGLIVLNKAKRVGLKTIYQLTGLTPGKINTRHIGFVIGPRINAAGRMKHAQGAFDLLISESLDEAQNLTFVLQEDNSQRQKSTDSYLITAREQVQEQINQDNKILFAFDPDWNLGLVGLVAGRLLEEFGRPVMVMAEIDGKIKGSGRSIKEWHITETLDKIADVLDRYGGHAGACGFTLKDKKLLEEFKNKLIKLANQEIKDKDLLPVLDIDIEIPLSQVDWELFEELDKFAPFGQDVPAPRFLTKKLEVTNVEPVGLDQKHLRIFVDDDKGTLRKTIAFGFGKNWRDELKIGDKIDLVYEVEVNEWNGNRELQLKVVDLKLS